MQELWLFVVSNVFKIRKKNTLWIMNFLKKNGMQGKWHNSVHLGMHEWRGIHEEETRDSTEHLVNYGTAQVSHAGLSVKAMVKHLGDYFECHCNVMHLLLLSSDLRLLFDRVQSGIPKARGSRSHSIIWQELQYVITAAASKCLRGEEIAGDPEWPTNFDWHFNWNMRNVSILRERA